MEDASGFASNEVDLFRSPAVWVGKGSDQPSEKKIASRRVRVKSCTRCLLTTTLKVGIFITVNHRENISYSCLLTSDGIYISHYGNTCGEIWMYAVVMPNRPSAGVRNSLCFQRMNKSIVESTLVRYSQQV